MTTMMSMDQMKSDFGGKKLAKIHNGDETMMEMGSNVGYPTLDMNMSTDLFAN
jgi:hypothetical protein